MYILCTYIGFFMGFALAAILHMARSDNNNNDNDQ